MDKSKSYNIQKFEGKNFQLWKFQLEIIFRAEGLLDLVNGKTERPEDDREKEKAWDDKNAKAMLIISTAMEFDQLQVIIACKNAAEMWMRLKTIHEQRSAVNKIALKQQFFNYKMSETDTVGQHISKIETMAQSLADVGEPVGEIDKIAKTLGSLPFKYGSFITAWDSYDENKQTFDNLTARLLKEEQRLAQGDETTSALAALKSECRKLQSKRNAEKSQNNSQALSAEIKNILTEGYENVWLADSAASKHMTFHKEWFTTFKPISSVSIQIGDNSFVKAEGVGTVSLMALVNNEWQPRTLENTLYVPNLRKNLFSIGAVTDKNFKVIFDDQKIEVRKNQLVVKGIKLSNHCYKMLFKMFSVEQANVSVNQAKLWHDRLGHVNNNTLKDMANNGMLPNVSLKDVNDLFCESCQYGKAHRKTFSSISQSRVFKPGEFIHTDVCGKMPVTSVGGANYYVLFKDDITSYRFV
ncbi:GAG-pre-integrase domain [Popillia japonica]|uniref:GAG-pre-integrase domain n=1 Tax=Popillia japonica TaxID=7064 RepID=A0AAW1MG03_POPJA